MKNTYIVTFIIIYKYTTYHVFLEWSIENMSDHQTLLLILRVICLWPEW